MLDDIKIVKLTATQISIEDFNILTKSCNGEHVIRNTSAYGIISQEFKNIFTNRIELLMSFICPITQKIMIDPVLCADDINYERQSITLWLETHDTSPVSGQPLVNKDLISNDRLRDVIQTFQQQLGATTQSSSSDEKPVHPVEIIDQSKLIEQTSDMFFLKSILSLFRNQRDPYLLYADHLITYKMDCSLPMDNEHPQEGLDRFGFSNLD